ncbi:RIP metalloprotease RseP [Camelliibacillus cellulosilyticus]|uniref:Zinc metalloprotease n=1 Tax=Camelliibacillus cellulosilyticus TaxID=2174486 RepID=A0ABV9GGE2_9BACL
METLIAVVIIFGLLVSFHEFGHLLVAKRSGILCREYAIGFGPKLFSFKKNETVYTLRLLPIGGYVRMAGEDPEIIEINPGQRIGLIFNREGTVSKIIINQIEKFPDAKMVTADFADLEKDLVIQGYEEEDGDRLTFHVDRKAEYVIDGQAFQIAPLDRQFGSKPLLARILTIFAGPFMNFILAFIVFVIFFALQGIPTDKPEMGKLISGDPAASSGLQQGDQVLKINDQPVDSFTAMTKIIKQHPNENMIFTIKRDGSVKQINVKADKNKQGEGVIGVYQPTETSFLGSLKGGITQTYFWVKMELVAVKQLVTGQIGLNQLAGPVGIYDITGQMVQSGFFTVMRWTAVLSINLGIVNLLPLPALDGGRLLFLFIEGIRGKPVDPKRETLVHFIGFALLMLLMIVVTWNDIQRLFM